MTPILIPTRYKSKLPALLSWPIGAEELSTALADVSVVSAMEITFYFSHTRDIEIAKRASRLELVNFQYARRAGRIFDSAASVDAGVLKPHWTIQVRPVARERRKKLHDGILECMPRVSELLKQRASLHVLGNSTIQLVWSADQEVVYISLSERLEPERNRS